MKQALFKLSQPAFNIAGRGVVVLTGIPSIQPCPFKIGDTLVFHSPWMARKASIHSIEHALIKTAEEEYGLVLSSISAEDLPKGTEAHDHKTLIADRDVNAPPVWTGDLADDCSSTWAEMVLRAEEMSLGDWWWAVSDNRLALAEVGSSNWEGQPCVSGESARRQAERCAQTYLKPIHTVSSLLPASPKSIPR